MTVTLKDVERATELANLELTSSEKTGMLRDLNSVLDYFAELNELDTTSVPPMLQALQADDLHLRPDEVAPSLDRTAVLACAPDTDGTFFKVPKVIER
jgi:aspartyl-tRNA(Asn)/glutamyl-tRNA(Gln) amidotransferase subunit C